ncbi:ABC-type transport auxiliary lipoprotein family protein [Vibrio profundum]|uniref:PqiC family protein n=1 Tax=Vibrio profundum TaxID=2910247 RepID=UPI003D0AB7F6
MGKIATFSTIVAIGLLLSACSSNTAPTTHEYLLPNQLTVSAYQVQPERAGYSIQLKAIKVADYLSRLNIVMVSDSGQVYPAANHLWAAPLTSQLENLTINRLTERLPTISWLPSYQPFSAQASLEIDVADMYANLKGDVVISGRWFLVANTDDHLIDSGTFKRHAQLQQDGYPALTDQLSKTWLNQVIDPIARKLTSLKSVK